MAGSVGLGLGPGLALSEATITGFPEVVVDTWRQGMSLTERPVLQLSFLFQAHPPPQGPPGAGLTFQISQSVRILLQNWAGLCPEARPLATRGLQAVGRDGGGGMGSGGGGIRGICR